MTTNPEARRIARDSYALLHEAWHAWERSDTAEDFEQVQDFAEALESTGPELLGGVLALTVTLLHVMYGENVCLVLTDMHKETTRDLN
jgi:hypothetical protein